MLGFFPFIIMFLVTSIAMLRERTTGTLERLLTTPLAKTDLLFGYGIAFGLAGAVQAGIASAVAYWVFGLQTAGSSALVIMIAALNAVLAVALGLLCSAFARTEFQAVQFMPVVVAPQLLLCGLFVPRDEMAGWLQAISDVLPLSYAVEALQEVGTHAEPTGTMWRDVAIVAAAAVLALVLAAAASAGAAPPTGAREGDGTAQRTATRQTRHPGHDPRRGPGRVRRTRLRRQHHPGHRRSAGRPALVHHYFGTKEQLFLAAMRFPVNPGELLPKVLAGDRAALGERLVRMFVTVWDSPAGAAGVALLRSAVSSEWTARLLREFLTTQVLRRVLDHLDVDPAEVPLRGSLVASQLVGLALMRYVIRLEPVASAAPETLIATVGPTVHRYLTGALDGVPHSAPSGR